MAVGAQCICLVCRRTSPMRPYNNNDSNNCNIFTSHPASAHTRPRLHTYNFLRCIKFFTSCPGGGYVIIIERSAVAAVWQRLERKKSDEICMYLVWVCVCVRWTYHFGSYMNTRPPSESCSGLPPPQTCRFQTSPAKRLHQNCTTSLSSSEPWGEPRLYYFAPGKHLLENFPSSFHVYRGKSRAFSGERKISNLNAFVYQIQEIWISCY